MKQQTLVSFLEENYPKEYAMDWDNVGLQTGDLKRDISGLLIALDLRLSVVETAIESNCNMIITHHPLLFKSISQINAQTPIGQILDRLIKNDITVYSMHTNLDVARNGVSDVLASSYNLKNTKVLTSTFNSKLFKLVVYIPESDFENCRSKLLDLNIGHIGNYSHCSFSTKGAGTFKPLDGANPYIGDLNVLEHVNESKFETVIDYKNISTVINQLKQIHPYEEIAYDLVPLANDGPAIGLGRYGEIDAVKLSDFPLEMPGIMKGDTNCNKMIKKVAVCGGNGSALIKRVIDLGIDLYISSEIGYHDELLAADYGLSIYDIGHYNSEKAILPYLQNLINCKYAEEIPKVIVV